MKALAKAAPFEIAQSAKPVPGRRPGEGLGRAERPVAAYELVSGAISRNENDQRCASEADSFEHAKLTSDSLRCCS